MSDITIINTLTSTLYLPVSTSGPQAYVTTLYHISTVTPTSTSNTPQIVTVQPSTLKQSYRQASSSTEEVQTSQLSTKIVHATPSASDINGLQLLSNSDPSLKIGLAVGIPIAVIVIFAALAGFFVWLRKRNLAAAKSSSQLYPDEKWHNFERSTSLSTSTKIPERREIDTALKIFERRGTDSSLKTFERKEPADLSQRTLSYETKERSLPSVELAPPNAADKRNLVRTFFRDRLSRCIDGDIIPPGPPLSPLFLKKFRLAKPKEASSSLVKNPRNKYDLKLSIIASHDRFIVVKAYEKLLDDEVTINPGDVVTIIKDYSDGWCKIALSSGEQGFVPRVCLELMEERTDVERGNRI